MIFTPKAVIDLNAFVHNVNRIKNKTKAKIYAVVKANAYGHGISAASYLQHYVDGFCVATASEAKQLVHLSIYKPILILGALRADMLALPYENIIYSVGSLSDAKAIGENKGKRFYVKLNTGMNRLGCDVAELREIMNYVRHNALKCEGIYTHFFLPEDALSTNGQYRLLEEAISASGEFCECVHCRASGALCDETFYRSDIVRAGLALYGYGEPELKPVMSVCAPVIKIHNLKEGENVGYGVNRVMSDCRIAVLRIGYGDGYRRIGRPGRCVSINGSRCPIVGQVCMDMCMADISKASVSVGDYAYVLGKGITAQELAKEYGTIVYEVLTSFNERVERVYVGK